MSKTEPTPGAMKAAEKIYSDSAPIVGEDDYTYKLTDHENEVNRAAIIIDQETAAPELLEVLREFVKQAEHKKRCCGSYGHLEDVTIKAQAAITKAQGANDEKN